MSASASCIPNRQKRKSAYRARHRLLSIHRDATSLAEQRMSPPIADTRNWPWIPNKQCGSWYLPETSDITPVYFKSTDGHVGTYNFSLKRLNLHLIAVLHEFSGCYLVDSSVRKVLPDSFSRTIPIWCCVLNRIVQKYRDEMNLSCDHEWDTNLYTPSSIVSAEEHALIYNLIDSRVQLLYDSKAIVDPKRLVTFLDRPLRALWLINEQLEGYTNVDSEIVSMKDVDYYTIVCYNPSIYDNDDKNHIRWIENTHDKEYGYYYTPGAADDDATWGRGLNYELFWSEKKRLLDPTLNDDDVDRLIDTLMSTELDNDTGITLKSRCINHHNFVDKIGDLNLWIGSRKAGRPPECWEYFEAVLNVTKTEYPAMTDSIKNGQDNSTRTCFYLMLPVAEGKKDKTELERWLPVGLYFLIYHLQSGRRVLVHCAQGKDRSVALVLALVVIVCRLEYPLKPRQDFDAFNLEALSVIANDAASEKVDEVNIYQYSGLPENIVSGLLDKSGHDMFLKWAHQYIQSPGPLANKHSIRIALHLIQQDREVAEPSRSTMQKLNRFFMSSSLYRPTS